MNIGKMSPIRNKTTLICSILICFTTISSNNIGLSFAQQNGPPKILPIATADSYPEGSSINLICTVSGGQRKGLHLGWIIQGREVDHHSIKRYSGSELPENLSIRQDETDISILRIINATNTNSGDYTCLAKNPLGEDSTTVKIIINVELKWKKIPKDTEIGLNQDLALECEAIGLPEPRIEWLKHQIATPLSSDRNSSGSPIVVAKGTSFRINRVKQSDSAIYECIARNGFDQQQTELRRVFQVKVKGK